MTDRNKLFPLRLPETYHGEAKPFRRPSEIYLEKSSQKDQVEAFNSKISKWQRKILDKDVISERKEFVVHPSKISQDNPAWLKSTYHHFHRSSTISMRKETKDEKKQYDVFGRKKIDPLSYQSQQPTGYGEKFKPEVTGKVGVSNSEYLTNSHYQLRSQKSEIAPKVGSIETRENHIRKPQLKVGSQHGYNFVDTYSVN